MSDLTSGLEERVKHELPGLSTEQAGDLARVLERIVGALAPERIYVFGSQARGEATNDSDIDLLVVVPRAEEPAYRLAQQAYRALDDYLTPLDILVITTGDFERRSVVRSSLPATVLREGRMLYAA